MSIMYSDCRGSWYMYMPSPVRSTLLKSIQCISIGSKVRSLLFVIYTSNEQLCSLFFRTVGVHGSCHLPFDQLCKKVFNAIALDPKSGLC